MAIGDKDRPVVRLLDAALSLAASSVRSALEGSRGRWGQKERVALVLSGGIGLGAYQSGAYAELHEAGGLRPDWIAGSSTGAANAALIAGGPPETSVERLRRFWDAVGKPSPFPFLPSVNEGPWRHALNWMSVMQTRMFGSSRYFRPLLPFERAASLVPSLYDLTPTRELLQELVDFDQLNDGPMQISIVTTDVLSGEEVIFDTGRGARINVEHILASSGFLPDFAPVEIEGRLLGDGGFSANAPLGAILFDEAAREDVVCFVVDLFSRDGGPPRSIEAGLARRVDLMFSSQTEQSLGAFKREAHLRAMINRLGVCLPPDSREDPEVVAALGEGRAMRAIVLHLSYRAPDDEAGFEKPFDVSRASVSDRWRAGARDMADALRTLASLPREGGSQDLGASIHKVRC